MANDGVFVAKRAKYAHVMHLSLYESTSGDRRVLVECDGGYDKPLQSLSTSRPDIGLAQGAHPYATSHTCTGDTNSTSGDGGSTTTWSAPIEKHDVLVDQLKFMACNILPVPVEVLNLVRYASRSSGKCDVDATFERNVLPCSERSEDIGGFSGVRELYEKLLPHQQSAVNFLIGRNGGRGINAGDMGTGKTLTAIFASVYYRVKYSGGRHLVISPASVKQNWVNEFKTFVPSVSVTVLKSEDTKLSDVNIISYALATSAPMQSKLLRTGYGLMVLDESHLVKSTKSKRAKLAFKLSRAVPHVILLSGTPASRPCDLFQQLKIVAGPRSSAFGQFAPYVPISSGTQPLENVISKCRRNGSFFYGYRYCDPRVVFAGPGRFEIRYKGSSFRWELNLILSHYMTRCVKDAVLRDLPPIHRKCVRLDCLSPEEKTNFNGKLQKLEQLRETSGKSKADAYLMSLVRETSHIKLKYTLEYIETLLLPTNDINSENTLPDKYLLFAHHKHFMDAIATMLTSIDCSFIRIDGGTPAAKRQDLVNRFQSVSDGVRVALLSICAAGTGLNMQAANVVIFAELIWSDKDHLQSECRAHRKNQTRSVDVRYVVAKSTTDDIMFGSITKKAKLARSILGDDKWNGVGYIDQT